VIKLTGLLSLDSTFRFKDFNHRGFSAQLTLDATKARVFKKTMQQRLHSLAKAFSSLALAS